MAATRNRLLPISTIVNVNPQVGRADLAYLQRLLDLKIHVT
jgi:hypothetical protein